MPDTCDIDVDVRYLPNQDPGEILAEIRAIADRGSSDVPRVRGDGRAADPYVRALRDALSGSTRARR